MTAPPSIEVIADDKEWRELFLQRSNALQDALVRIVHGDRDPRPVCAVESLVAALPRAELTVLAGVGHLAWLEDPAAFGRVASEFVVDVASRVDPASPDAPGPRGRDDPTGSRHT